MFVKTTVYIVNTRRDARTDHENYHKVDIIIGTGEKLQSKHLSLTERLCL